MGIAIKTIDSTFLGSKITDFNNNLLPTLKLKELQQHGFSNDLYTLNIKEALKNISSEKQLKDILKLHGIPFVKKGYFLKKYIIYVFQTKIIAMYFSKEKNALLNINSKTEETFYKEVDLNETNDKEIQKIKRFAIKAVYALNLDYSLVYCGTLAGKKNAIINIIVNPKVEEKIEQEYLKAINEYINAIKSKENDEKILLGSDIEFVMKSPKGQLLIASNYFPLKGRVGCDAIWIGRNSKQKPLVELRPLPSKEPKELVNNIYKCLLYVAKKMNKVPSLWLAGSMPINNFPLGGHIHFSNVALNFKFLRVLDNYLAFPFILIEERERGLKRRPKYGFLGDFRYQFHGGFEYRTLASFIFSPTLTKGVFALAYLIAKNYHKLNLRPLYNLSLQEAYYMGIKEKIEEWTYKLWDDISYLDGFQTYSNYINNFFRYLTRGSFWNEEEDFKKNWKLDEKYG